MRPSISPSVQTIAAPFLREVERQTSPWHPDAAQLTRALALAGLTDGCSQTALRSFGHPGSIRSRLDRAGLASPKTQLVLFRLTLALFLMEAGWTNADIAYAIGFTSPQSFGRHVREQTGKTAREFAASTKSTRFWIERVVPAIAFEDARWTTLAVLGHPLTQAAA